MIYLASPYSHDDAGIRSWRFSKAQHYCLTQIRRGHPIFSPIVYCHQFALMGMQGDFNTWRSFNHHMLQRCTALHIYKLPGWLQSVGVKQEVEYVKHLNKTSSEERPIVYIDFVETAR